MLLIFDAAKFVGRALRGEYQCGFILFQVFCLYLQMDDIPTIRVIYLVFKTFLFLETCIAHPYIVSYS